VGAIRKTEEASKRAPKQLRRHASRDGEARHPETLEEANYVLVLTTFDPLTFSAAMIRQWSRVRWQGALAFKRRKALAQLGQLPQADEPSARAWLSGKLVVALLTEQLLRRGQVLSPCRAPHTAEGSTLSLARVCVRLAPPPACDRTKPHVALCTGFVAPALPGVN
jgi:hypothetical protein